MNLLVKETTHKKAYKYLDKKLHSLGINLKSLVSEKKFKKRYLIIKDLNVGIIDREEMPVISYKNTSKVKFYLDIITGKNIQKIKKYSKQLEYFFDEDLINIEDIKNKVSSKLKDKTNTSIHSEIIKIKANKLIPVQNELHIQKIIKNIIKYGIPSKNNFIQERTLIVTKNNKIIDGNHRWLTTMIFKPNLEIEVLKIDLDFEDLHPIILEFEELINKEGK